MRSCLHCALTHALRAEADRLRARGVTIVMGRSEPLWLPIAGARVYRALRRLLQAAGSVAEPGKAKLSVLDMLGKSHVEVTIVVPAGRRVRVLCAALPRHSAAALPRGFVEGVG